MVALDEVKRIKRIKFSNKAAGQAKKASDAFVSAYKGKENKKNKRSREEILKIPEEERTFLQRELLKFTPRWRVVCPKCGRDLGEFQYRKEIPKKMMCGATQICGKEFWTKAHVYRIEGIVVPTNDSSLDVYFKREFTEEDKSEIVRMHGIGLSDNEIANVLDTSPQILKSLYRMDSEFTLRCEAAKDKVKEKLVTTAHKLAESGNPSMLSLVLKTRYGYNENHHVKHSADKSFFSVSSPTVKELSGLSVTELLSLKEIYEKIESKSSDNMLIEGEVDE